MVNKLDQVELELRNTIKRISDILNGVNRHFRKFKKSLFLNKQALLILTQNFQSGKIDANRFKGLVLRKVANIMGKIESLKDDFETLGGRVDAAKRLLQAEHQLDPQNPDQLVNWLGINLNLAKEHLQGYLNRLELIERLLTTGEHNIIEPRNVHQIENLINITLDNAYNMFGIIEKGTQKEMKAILKVYTTHFKMYKIAKHSRL